MYVAHAYEDCPVCSSRMTCGEIDDRSEWCRCEYYCRTCDYTFSKLVTFKIQSDEVENEVWEDLPGMPQYEKGQLIHFMWSGWRARGRVWKRHLRDSTFHYHIDCPSVVSGEPPDIEREFTKSELS